MLRCKQTIGEERLSMHNKKFELTLTRCAQAYSSYWPTAVK